MKPVYIFLTLIFAAFSTNKAAHASSCIKAPFEKAYQAAELVFVGKAEKVVYFDDAKNRACGDKLATFTVSKHWKGDVTRTVDVFAADSCLMLGAHFEEGKTYLVYALPQNSEIVWKGKNRNTEYRYDASICSRTAPIETPDAAADIKQLDQHPAK